MTRHPPPRHLRSILDEPDAGRRGLCWVSLTALVAFVPDRRLPGNGHAHPQLYVKTHPATVLARCPTCGASPGRLCSRGGPTFGPRNYLMNMPHGDRVRVWAKHQRKERR